MGLGFLIAPRKKVPALVGLISGIDSKAVVTIEDVRYSNIVEYFQPVGTGSRWLRFLKKK